MGGPDAGAPAGSACAQAPAIPNSPATSKAEEMMRATWNGDWYGKGGGGTAWAGDHAGKGVSDGPDGGEGGIREGQNLSGGAAGGCL